MAEKFTVRSAVPKFLARQHLSVADLVRRMEEQGFRFDKKTIYRLASDAPVRNLNLPVVAAIGRVLKLSDPGKLIDWSVASGEPPRLQLMGKNTEGTLNAAERRELDRLGRLVEKLSLENARLLASHGSAANGTTKRRATTLRRTRPRAPLRPRPSAEAAIG